jgi:hypothetical protein
VVGVGEDSLGELGRVRPNFERALDERYLLP